ncbi:hypothetical protein ACHAWX_004489 [Stephanocyclus meneghinianus]
MTNQDCRRERHHQMPAYDDHYFSVPKIESQCSNQELRVPSLRTSAQFPSSAQRLNDKHTTAQGLILPPVTTVCHREPYNSCQAPFQIEQRYITYPPRETACDALNTSSNGNENDTFGAYGQCELPTVIMAGVFEYFQEALSQGSRTLTNDASSEGQDVYNKINRTHVPETESKENNNIALSPVIRRETITITAMKQPGKRAGVIFSRLSSEQPNVAIISMIMHDSIFAQHNKNFEGKLEGSVVVAVNGIIVDDARHAARLVIMAEGEVSLVVEISPLKSELKVEEEKERIVCDAVDLVQDDFSQVGADQNVDEIRPDTLTLEKTIAFERNDATIHPTIVKRDPPGLEFSDAGENNDIGSTQILESIPSVQSTLEEGMELEYNGVAGKTDLVDMAPSSLKLQLKNRMESKKYSFNPLHQHYTSLMVSSSCSTSEGSSASSVASSISRRRMNLFADRLDDNSTIHSDASRTSRLFGLGRDQASRGPSITDSFYEEAIAATQSNCVEDEIMTPKKNNTNKKLARICATSDSYHDRHQSYIGNGFEKQRSQDTKQEYEDDSQHLYANNSSLTESTASLTRAPSTLYDDGSVIDIQSVLGSRATLGSLSCIENPSKMKSEATSSIWLKPESNNSTFKRVKTDGTLNIVPCAYNADEESVKDLPTPVLIQKIENLFGNVNNTLAIPFFSTSPSFDVLARKKTTNISVSPVSSTVEKSAISSSASSHLENNVRANDVFDRIMNKYAKMSFDSAVQETQSKGSNQTEIFVARDLNNDMSSLSSASLERVATNEYFSNLLRQNGSNKDSISQSNSVIFTDASRALDALEAKAVHQSGSASNSLHYRMKMMEIELKESIDSDDNSAHFVRVGINEYEDDDVSTLSRSTCLTIGSASFCSTDTKEIQSHVRSLVHGIVQKEIENSGTMKKELEEALKSKAILESRVRKLVRRNNKQQMELKKAHIKNETFVEEIDKELTFHLTRKAAELKSCVEVALEQAEESKRRALEIARSDMEQEILALRAELDEALENGVYLDASLQRALALVESNRRTLRLAAESDVRDAITMKNNIENSFVNTVDEFETWAEKQVSLMERMEEAMLNSGGIKAEDEAKLLKIKESLESAMCGMERMQYRMKTRTESGNYSGYV